MKNGIFLKQHADRSETLVFATLGLAGLVIIAVGLLTSSDFVKGKDGVIAHLSGNSSRSAGCEPWRVEVRNWVAMIRYVLEPEPGPLLNVSLTAQPAAARPQFVATNATSRAYRPLG